MIGEGPENRGKKTKQTNTSQIPDGEQMSVRKSREEQKDRASDRVVEKKTQKKK